MKIKKAVFVKGVVGDDYGTKGDLPHIAFFGRSNAGKSSLINSLTGEKNLVKVSKLPGKTREANFFRINDAFYLVDFPGYGYAKFSIAERNKIIKRIFWYIKLSKNRPKAVFLIIDAKVGLTVLDREMIEILRENNHQIIVIANKIDKLGKVATENRLSEIRDELGDIPVMSYSAKTDKGRDELIEVIAELIK